MEALECYTGSVSGWFQIPGLENVVSFSSDIQNNPLSNHLEVIGHFNQATPTWDINLTDAYGTVSSATNLAYWNNGSSPSQGEGLSGISFQTFNSIADTVIDNVSVYGSAGEYITNGNFENTSGWGVVGSNDHPRVG